MGGRIMRVGVAVVLVGVLAAARLDAAVIEANLLADDVAAWNGFSPDFQPSWEGDTTTVKMRPEVARALGTAGCWDISGCICAWDSGSRWHPQREQRWTVNRVSSSASAVATANAQVDLVGKRYSASKSGEAYDDSTTNAQFARFAEVVTDTGLLLAHGSAIAYQNANIDGQSLSVDGSFSAATLLNEMVKQGSADASGKSSFTATYKLERATPFSLDLDLAQLGEANLCFRALDDTAGKELFACETLSGVSRHVELTGILDAGQYTFKLGGSVSSALDSSGLVDLAGMGSYNVDLDFQAESYWVDRGAILRIADDAEQPSSVSGATRGDGCCIAFKNSGGSFWSVPAVAIIDAANNTPSVPEPTTPALLLFGAVAAWGMFRRRSKGAL